MALEQVVGLECPGGVVGVRILQAGQEVVGLFEHATRHVRMQVEQHRNRYLGPNVRAHRGEQFAFDIVRPLCALGAMKEQEDPVHAAGARQIGEHLVTQRRPVGR